MPELMRGLKYTDGVAETLFENERCVVAFDAKTAQRQSDRRRKEIDALEAFGQNCFSLNI